MRLRRGEGSRDEPYAEYRAIFRRRRPAEDQVGRVLIGGSRRATRCEAGPARRPSVACPWQAELPARRVTVERDVRRGALGDHPQPVQLIEAAQRLLASCA